MRPPFEFARKYTVDDILTNPAKAQQFKQEFLRWEGEYFRAARDPDSGMAHDGLQLDPRTGEVRQPRPWSAPSKESLDLAVCAKAVAGDPSAVQVLGGGDRVKARAAALEILGKKLHALEDWNARHPEYGGYLPWMSVEGGKIEPSADWKGGLPGLDNGEWAWAMLTTEHVLRTSGESGLAERFHAYNEGLKKNATKIFWDAEEKKVRADVIIHAEAGKEPTYHTTPVGVPRRVPLVGYDAHEGLMMHTFVTTFGEGLTDADREASFDFTRFERFEHEAGTTWRGNWASPHESWPMLFLPFRDHPGFREVLAQREVIRTQNAAARGYPGLAASATEANNDPAFTPYRNNAGIEGVAHAKLDNDNFAPYGAYMLALESKRENQEAYALAWLLNMLQQPHMQTRFGALEAGRNDGTAVAAGKTADGSFTLLLGMADGLDQETAAMLRAEGKYDAFMERVRSLYDKSFGTEPIRRPVSYARPPKARE